MDNVLNVLDTILKSIVSYPDAVEMHVSLESDDHGELEVINVKVHNEDVGACIGKKGGTAEAIRKIVGLAGFKLLDKRVYVRIDAPKLPKAHFQFSE
jgi:predicted RNA-binding protein YlqC (UPF0109 family)